MGDRPMRPPRICLQRTKQPDPPRPKAAKPSPRPQGSPRPPRKAVSQQRVARMGRHPASIAGAAGDTALNAESAEVSGATEKVLGDLRSLGDGFGVLDSSPATSMDRNRWPGRALRDAYISETAMKSHEIKCLLDGCERFPIVMAPAFPGRPSPPHPRHTGGET